MDNSIKNNKIVKYSIICFVTLMIIITLVALLLSNSPKKKSMASNIEYITEDITDCSIYEAEGVDWCTSKEFLKTITQI